MATGSCRRPSTTLSYDAVDREIRKDLASGSHTSMTYDAADQLVVEHRNDTLSSRLVTYVYDPVGNRLARNDDGDRTTYAYDAGNQLRTAESTTGVTSYSYDADGNQNRIETPSGDLTTSAWDAEDHLLRVEQPAGERATLSYGPVTRNGDLKRYSREDATGTLLNRWDSDNVVQQTDDLGTLEVTYTVLPSPQPQGDLLSQRRDTESDFYHFDGRTHTAVLTDASEVETDTYRYDAFGVVVATTGTTENDCQYMGQVLVFAESALGTSHPSWWARARLYDPSTGRWRSEDPIRDDESNLYRYVWNDPVSLADPSGLQPRMGCDAGPPNALLIISRVEPTGDPTTPPPSDDPSSPRCGADCNPSRRRLDLMPIIPGVSPPNRSIWSAPPWANPDGSVSPGAYADWQRAMGQWESSVTSGYLDNPPDFRFPRRRRPRHWTGPSVSAIPDEHLHQLQKEWAFEARWRDKDLTNPMFAQPYLYELYQLKGLDDQANMVLADVIIYDLVFPFVGGLQGPLDPREPCIGPVIPIGRNPGSVFAPTIRVPRPEFWPIAGPVVLPQPPGRSHPRDVSFLPLKPGLRPPVIPTPDGLPKAQMPPLVGPRLPATMPGGFLRIDFSQLPENVLYRIVRGDAKGRPFGSPRNPNPPTLSEFNPRLLDVRADTLRSAIKGVKHPLSPEQQASIAEMSNAELLQFRLSDPMSATGGPTSFSITGGHHRLHEILRRVECGDIPRTTVVRVLP